MTDAFVAKYDATGQVLWVRQFGTIASEGAGGVSADGMGNVYFSGFTQGSLEGINAGGSDLYVQKFDAAGTLIWSHQFGSASDDAPAFGGAVTADGVGDFFVAGQTMGTLGGPNAGSDDVFLTKFANGLPGDFNTDGTVDAADYITWRNGLGSEYTQDHYAEWRATFGRTAAGTAAVGKGVSNPAVPESNSLMLIAPALISIVKHRRRGRLNVAYEKS